MTLIQVQLKERIGTIAFDPYAKRNTLGADLIAEMLGTLDEFAREGVGVVVIRSASNERVWSAGHDVDELPLADADPISAERALRAGFVNEVPPRPSWRSASTRWRARSRPVPRSRSRSPSRRCTN